MPKKNDDKKYLNFLKRHDESPKQQPESFGQTPTEIMLWGLLGLVPAIISVIWSYLSAVGK